MSKVIKETSWKDGKQVSKTKLEELEKQVLDYLQKNPDPFYAIQTGNSIVIGHKFEDKHIKTIIVDSGYVEKEYEVKK